MTITQTNNGRIEQYYDDKGKPINKYSGYYAVFREYDEKGHNIQNTYLDSNNKPIMTINGYAIEKREFDENSQVVSIRYYDTTGLPVVTALYGHGKNNEYDENGNVYRTIYVDEEDKPIMTEFGYASIKYNHYTDGMDNNKKTEDEFYYDEEDKPIALDLGEYGVRITYNENEQRYLLTYLDQNGNPTITNKGYSTVERTFQSDNSVATEMYFDIQGEPVSLDEGQFGVDRTNGQIVYLNRNGDKIFNLRNVLYNHSWFVVPIALFIIILSALVDKQGGFFLAIFYVCIIIYFTLLYRNNNIQNGTELLWNYRHIITNDTARIEILRNIWLFIPLGAILYRLYPQKKVLLVAIALSISIEVLQYVTKTGFCDLDDVISNGIGGLVGIICEQKILVILRV